MLRAIIALATLMAGITTLSAKHNEAVYDVSFGMLGKVGASHAVLDTNATHYTIRIDMKATGAAKSLSGNRQEVHRSFGHLSNGRLIADRYEVERTYGKKTVRKSYRFDHRAHRIHKLYEKFKNGKRYDRQESVLPFYTTDDLLTLYFNLDRYIDKRKPGTYRFKTVGAERQGGFVELIVPDAKAKQRYIDDLGPGAAWYATAIIHQKLFTNEEGRLELAVGKDGITEKALIKDVALFGDVKAVRVK